MPSDWTTSMAWMRMPEQAWLGAAASFLGMWGGDCGCDDAAVSVPDAVALPPSRHPRRGRVYWRTEFGPGFDPEMIRIKLKRILSWGIDTNWNAPANARFVA